MTNVHIDDAFAFGRIGPPDQWREVPHTLRASFPPVKCSTYDRADINALHTLIKQIRYAAYVRDAGRDVWEANIKGDCEDKCLFLIRHYVGTEMYNSMRLAICVLPNRQQHAVILLYTDANTFVIDPTLSIMAVPWEKYPVQKWLIRHSHGFLWENFKEKLMSGDKLTTDVTERLKELADQYEPDADIDLHGWNADDAYDAGFDDGKHYMAKAVLRWTGED